MQRRQTVDQPVTAHTSGASFSLLVFAKPNGMESRNKQVEVSSVAWPGVKQTNSVKSEERGYDEGRKKRKRKGKKKS